MRELVCRRVWRLRAGSRRFCCAVIPCGIGAVQNASAAAIYACWRGGPIALRMLLLCLADWQVDLHAVLSDEQMPVEETIDGFVPVPLGVIGVV